MKKIYIYLLVLAISVMSILLIYNKENKTKYSNYNGIKMAIVVDGKKTDTLPTEGNYFLINYQCNNDSILTWDYNEKKLSFENHNTNDSCTLTFESSPKLYDLVKIGDYIAYTGDSNNGCNGNRCTGRNENQANINLYENYGYCSNENYKFTSYGWRVLYKEDNSVYIISGGAPECITSITNNSTQTIQNLNNASLKYCNGLYQSNGDCDYTTAHPFNASDFSKFTSQRYGVNNTRYLSSIYGSNYCYNKYSSTYCGYNDDVINNGSYYWFGSKYSTSNYYTLYRDPNARIIRYANGANSYGLRPVIKLDASIKTTGGYGTMTSPYTISERVTD